jgi:TRAP-type C4-dicarboxylate transport system permease small subunit
MEEITGHTAVWLYMIGAAYGTYDRSHIKAEFIHLIIKKPVILRSFRILASVVSILICIFMTIWSYEYVNWSLARHEVTPALHWPTVYFQIPILISSLLMTLYFFIEMVDLARNMHGHQAEAIG